MSSKDQKRVTGTWLGLVDHSESFLLSAATLWTYHSHDQPYYIVCHTMLHSGVYLDFIKISGRIQHLTTFLEYIDWPPEHIKAWFGPKLSWAWWRIYRLWWYWCWLYMSWPVKCSSTSTQRPKMLPNDKIVDGQIIVAARTGDMRRRTRQIWLQSWRNRYDSDYSFISLPLMIWTSHYQK